MKLIRNDSIGNYYFNSLNSWENSLWATNLNDYYYNRTSRDYDSYWDPNAGEFISKTFDMTNIGLKNDLTRNAIENVIWSIGGIDDLNNLTSVAFYTAERDSNSTRYTTWTGKIALPYPSDYLFAFGNQSDNYLSSHKNDWTVIPYIRKGNDDALFLMSGSTSINITLNYITPSIYLKSSFTVKDGDGSESNPYQLSVQ